MKVYYITTEGIGFNAPLVKPIVRSEAVGNKRVIKIDLHGTDPTGDGALIGSEEEMRDLYEALGKMFPTLAAVSGSKK